MAVRAATTSDMSSPSNPSSLSSTANNTNTNKSAGVGSASSSSPLRISRPRSASASNPNENEFSESNDHNNAMHVYDASDRNIHYNNDGSGDNGNGNDDDGVGVPTNASNSKRRSIKPPPRMNYRDIPRTYAGLYGNTDNLVPFELARKEHTDWIEQGGWLLLATYLGGIAIVQVLSVLVLEIFVEEDSKLTTTNILGQTLGLIFHPDTITSMSSFGLSWTLVHFIHCAVTLLYLHWCKGSPLYDVQNELAGLTLWEQLEGRPHTSVTKRTLTVIPTLLCYAACHFGNYHQSICKINVCIFWLIEVVAKLPMMNGVRILGINRTPGIDDHVINSSNSKSSSKKQL